MFLYMFIEKFKDDHIVDRRCHFDCYGTFLNFRYALSSKTNEGLCSEHVNECPSTFRHGLHNAESKSTVFYSREKCGHESL